MSFEINHMKVFSTWSYKDMLNKDCTICRQSLNNASIYNKEKGILKSQLQSNIGVCNHTFHQECITPWLQQYHRCPNCSQPWKS